MQKIILLNENTDKIGEIKVRSKLPKKTTPPIKTEKLAYQPLLDNNILGGAVITPYKNDYIVRNVSKVVPLVTKFPKRNLKGQPYFESLFLEPVDDFKNIIDNVYNTGKTRKVTLMVYEDEELIISFVDTIFKYEDSVIISIDYEKPFEVMFEQEKEMLENSKEPMAFIQNNKIIQHNSQYAKLFETNNKNIINTEFTTEKITFQTTPKSEIPKILNQIKNRKIYGFSEEAKIQQKKSTKWAIINIIPKTIHDQPGIHITFHDITKIKEKELIAMAIKHNLEITQEISKIAIVNYENNEYSWTSEIYKILDIKENQFDKKTDLIKEFLIPKDRITWTTYKKSNDITGFNDTLQVITQTGQKKYLTIQSKIQYNKQGEIKSISGIVQDVTEIMDYQKRLENTSIELTNALEEKEMLIKEVHHRVKNNLQIILSLMRLDKHINPNDPESALESARNRINYMATLHEKIYKSSDLTSIDIADYLPDVAKSLLTLYNNPINLQTNLDHATIDLDTAIPLGLILTELINNTIKYAFPNGEEGNLLITFNKEKTHGILTVMDDGIGLPENFNIEELDSLGFTVIKTLTQQIEGSLIQIKDIKGTGFKIFFPIKKRKKM